MTDVATADSANEPGGLRDYVRRDLDDGGLIEFEFAPAGYLTKKGDARRSDWRAYFWTAADGKRTRMISVTTLLSAIVPKGGLPIWAEARGIEGAIEAMRRKLLDPANTDQNHVEVVRANRLGADRARDDAAGRGISVHALLEAWSLAGSPPNPADFPPEQRGYVRALSRWIATFDPEPIAVEQLVCSPADGYAGRMDLKATVGGLPGLFDLKTQARGATYAGAHLQTAMYARADEACGGEPVSQRAIVVLSEHGEYRVQACAADDAAVDAALAYYQALKPIDSACQSANRAERKAREATAA